MGPSKKYNTCIMITAQKMKLSINEAFPFNEAFHFRRKLQIWSHLLKKYLMENFIFCSQMCNSARSKLLERCLQAT